MIRDKIKEALVGAIKAGDQPRRNAIRLIQAALKNRDIELRGAANPPGDDVLVTEVLQKMVKQRRESITMYEQGGRAELAAAVDAIVAETGASSIKDMGRVMALVKERHAGQLDMARASAAVKARLG